MESWHLKCNLLGNADSYRASLWKPGSPSTSQDALELTGADTVSGWSPTAHRVSLEVRKPAYIQDVLELTDANSDSG